MAWVYRLLVAGITVKLQCSSPVTRYPSGGIPNLENLKVYLLISISVKRWPHGRSNRCKNKTICVEKLSLLLLEAPPFMPRQFGLCAVIGNSGDLLKTKFGEEIDGYDAVVRENGTPIQNYTEYVGRKSTVNLLNRGSAKTLDKVAELDKTGKEVLIVKTTIHDIMNKMIRVVKHHLKLIVIEVRLYPSSCTLQCRIISNFHCY